MRIPKHARKELEAYLERGLLCRGFARLRCEECGESQLVAFSCKGRGAERAAREGGELCWQGLAHLKTSEVGAVLEGTLRRIERHLRRGGLLGIDQDEPLRRMLRILVEG